jgi:hypothetical protein
LKFYEFGLFQDILGCLGMTLGAKADYRFGCVYSSPIEQMMPTTQYVSSRVLVNMAQSILFVIAPLAQKLVSFQGFYRGLGLGHRLYYSLLK